MDEIDDPVQIYLKEACSGPPLTREEEAECVQHALSSDASAERAWKRLLEANLAMVAAVAQRHATEPERVFDLILVGNEALLEATKSFVAGETRFSDYARGLVERAIGEEEGRHDRPRS